VEFTLDDGSEVAIDEAEVAELYDQLWLLVPRPGAVTVAAKLKHHQAWPSASDGYQRLDARESAALIEALNRMNRA
jgi:hypothetical protein